MGIHTAVNIDGPNSMLAKLSITSKFVWVKSLPGFLLFVWVVIIMIAYGSGIISKLAFDTAYGIHIFYYVYQGILDIALWLPAASHQRVIATVYRVLVMLVFSWAGFLGTDWWLNILFLKNIEFISTLILTFLVKQFKKSVLINPPGTENKLLANWKVLGLFLLKKTKYIPLFVTLLLSFSNHRFVRSVLVASIILIDDY